jgi:hypothetical protein
VVKAAEKINGLKYVIMMVMLNRRINDLRGGSVELYFVFREVERTLSRVIILFGLKALNNSG